MASTMWHFPRQPWRNPIAATLVVTWFAQVRSQANDCNSTAGCVATCRNAAAQDAANCDVTCEEAYGRCACGVGAALRQDGSCTSAIGQDTDPCAPAFGALFNMALLSSPEVRASHLFEGESSAAFVTIIRYSVAEALEVPPSEVRTVGHELVPMASEPDDISAASGRILHFDLNFSFCGTRSTPSVHPADFERAFVREAQRFAAFSLGTARLLVLSSYSEDPLVDAQEAGQHGSSGEPGCQDCAGADWGAREQRAARASGGLLDDVLAVFLFYIMIGLCVVTLAALIGLLIVKRIRRKAHEQQEFMDEIFAPPDSFQFDHAAAADLEARHFDSAEPVIACAAQAYTPDPSVRGLLTLEEGDVIEVIASAGGLLFGKIVGEEGREGYFPESCVNWLGRPISLGHVDDSVSPTQVGSPVHRDSPHTPDRDSARAEDIDADENAHVSGWPVDDTVPASPAAGAVDAASVEGADGDRWTPPESPQCAPPPSKDAPRPTLAMVSAQGFVANVVAGFQAAEVEDSSVFEGQLLELEEGDVVKVEAAGEGWLYGAVVGVPDRVGYFPENRIDWLSLPQGAAGSSGTPPTASAGDDLF